MLVAALLTVALSGCASMAPRATMTRSPIFPAKTPTQVALNELPLPSRAISVAVYGFTDQTGKFEKVENGQTLSRAITQGGTSILVKALQDAGERKWFTVVERESLKDLLNERQIITEMRARYLGELNVNPQALPALLFAGVLLEGGVISYDTNTLTSGAGANILGIGVDGKYKQDTVTVYLRAVSVKTGEILTTVTTSKTITSVAVNFNVFAYVASDKILQGELGYTTNEPGQLALRQAIEKAVYALVMDGVDLKLWSFQDQKAGWPLLWRYRQERDGVISPAAVEAERERVRRAKAAAAKPPASVSMQTPMPGAIPTNVRKSPESQK
ncbi:CsgG/HfaB family protein [Sphingomonas sp. GB1N7]|uniref:CsgG/HfaB family protein n=1 Tax=Parasphingomonas caseinilytica TaxID=3096158 RepID=UPI002FCC4AE7